MLADRALSPMLGVALHAVSCASRLSRGVRHEFASKGGVLTKEDTSPVTVADFGVQALVTLFLREHAPADRFRLVAEEEADALSRDPTLLQTVTGLVNQHYPRYGTAVARRWAEADVLDALSQGGDGGGGEGAFWFLDPIDGTRGFVRGGHYAIGLGRISSGMATLSAIACPTLPHIGGSLGSSGILATQNTSPPTVNAQGRQPAAPSSAAPPGTSEGFVFGCCSTGDAREMSLSEAEALSFLGPPGETDWEGRMSKLAMHHTAGEIPSGAGEAGRGAAAGESLDRPLRIAESFAGELCAHRFRCFGGGEADAPPPPAGDLPSPSPPGGASRPTGITFLRLDSMAKYCLVAQGRADAYVRAPLPGGQSERIWDHAAALVVERAGGRVTDFEGKRIDFSKGRGLTANRGILATSASAPRWLHDEMIRCAPEACPTK